MPVANAVFAALRAGSGKGRLVNKTDEQKIGEALVWMRKNGIYPHSAEIRDDYEEEKWHLVLKDQHECACATWDFSHARDAVEAAAFVRFLLSLR